MRFRPCIDLHDGAVKQIVGSTLSDDEPGRLQTNFVATQPPAWYANLYRRDDLQGGHIIMLGSGNETAAGEALAAWPGGMQIGGGITAENAVSWLSRGASHVIVTSWVFHDGRIDQHRLDRLLAEVGRDRLVLDLSCRRLGADYFVVTDRWQRFTEVRIEASALAELAGYCAEFLIHAADVEGKCQGVETELIDILGKHSPIVTTYAGGIRDLEDLETIFRVGDGRLDASIGSALDIFGGQGITYHQAVAFHQRHRGNANDT
ncbi:MAG: phosphoribosylformimino-5-aminoimidazole carboxamide ribotide isomerase [Desulfofustis sp.]|nr:phosphoribosylformimino-5-aminoimidazole carboxamide ribotide isomerase [Desulfofustis sp.]